MLSEGKQLIVGHTKEVTEIGPDCDGPYKKGYGMQTRFRR